MHFMNHILLKISRWPVILLVLFFSWACSTQKDSFINRAYHSVNAKYNGFFNARESYKDGVERLSELHTDNYEQILSIFRYGTEHDVSAISGNMDITYEKASLVIRRHSMNIRGEEHNKWIDESYFLIGRSHFFKRDYTLAILTFEYIIRQYDTQRKYDSKVWIAKSYNQQQRYEQAMRMFDMLERNYRDGMLADETIALFRKAYADHYIRQGKYDLAAAQLEKGISYERSRRERSRLTFIQAQLYHHSEQYALAQQTYQKVLNMRPDRNMAFQARIGMALAYDPSVGGAARIREQLMNMLGEDRNRMYRDQIYYALAQLAMRQNNEQEAIRMYNRSVEVSEDNDVQKGLSFLRLGEIYFGHPDYEKANIYYDSATTYLPRSYDDYEKVSRRQQILANLAQLNKVIAREDSLQRLAAMSPEEQLAVVDKIIDDLREQERLRQEAERERMQAMRDAGRMARQTRGMGDPGGGGWYFYNQTTISNGKMEFFGRFGDRELEDLWRISNRQMIAGDFGMGLPGFEDMEAEEDTLEVDEFDRDTYLRNIPNTEEKMLASKNRQMLAHYNMGMIFRDRLANKEYAIESFNSVVQGFPGMEKELPSYYHMYFLHRELGDISAAELVKNSLLNLYPDSEYAKIIGDPGYADRVRSRQSRAEDLYREAYNAFFAGRYHVIERNKQALDTLNAPRELQARFAYLHALSIGKTERNAQFYNELKRVVDEFDGTPIHGPASVLLASLDVSSFDMLAGEGGEPGSRRRRDIEPIESPFNYSPDAVHFFVFVVNSNKTDPEELLAAIRTFNGENYEEKGLSASNIFYDENKRLITVTNFQGKENGLQYFRDLIASGKITEDQKASAEPFIISVDNYPLFFQEREIEAYRFFFDHYYSEL